MGAPAPTISGSIGRRKPPKELALSGVLERLRRNALLGRNQLAWALVLLLLLPVTDTHPGSVQATYEHAHRLFLQGDLIASQAEAEQGYRRFRHSKPEWAAKFQLLQAQALIFRGMNQDAIRV